MDREDDRPAPRAPDGADTGADASLGRLHFEVADQLMRGATYHRTARTLNVSERTVRRVVKDLMDKIRVNNHVQLGAEIQRRGWLNGR